MLSNYSLKPLIYKTILLGFLLFLLPSSVYAKNTWIDNFSQIDLNRWSIYNETSISPLIQNDALWSRGIDIDKSLFLQTIEEVSPSENVSITVRFKFLFQGFGSGIAINDQKIFPRTNNDPGLDDRTVIIWPQIGSAFAISTPICLEAGTCNGQNNLLARVGGEDFYEWHILKVNYDNFKYKIFFDNELIATTKQTIREPNFLWLGNPQITNTIVDFSEFYVDYVKIEEIEGIEGEIGEEDEFPYYSQSDPEWATEEYDSASKWAAEGVQGIDRWGCALTSAAMVLRHYEVDSPDGKEATPKVLNDWLNLQDDGYIRNGLINWLAVSRFSYKANESGNSSNTLEVTKNNYSSDSSYEMPSIFGYDNHFVVGHLENQDDYSIKDPGDEENVTIDKDYSINSVVTYTPSNTDLSYFMFVVDENFDISLSNKEGDELGTVYLEQPIEDDVGDGQSGEMVKLLLLPKPTEDTYYLKVSNNTGAGDEYMLDQYWYDDEGEVQIQKASGDLPDGSSDVYVFDYGENLSDVEAEITIDSIRDLMAHYLSVREIRSRYFFRRLDRFLRYADLTESAYFRERLLKVVSRYLSRRSRYISRTASEILKTKIDSLL